MLQASMKKCQIYPGTEGFRDWQAIFAAGLKGHGICGTNRHLCYPSEASQSSTHSAAVPEGYWYTPGWT